MLVLITSNWNGAFDALSSGWEPNTTPQILPSVLVAFRAEGLGFIIGTLQRRPEP